jgi:hypothetical protein
MYSKITDKQLQDWKKALAKSDIVYDTDDEYREAINNLVGYFDILIQMDLEQKRKSGEYGSQEVSPT